MVNMKYSSNTTKIKDGWLYLAISIVLFGLIIDVFVIKTNSYWIKVTESYTGYIYSSIVTIAILSFTLVALLSGLLNTRYYGYMLKDILGFKNSTIDLKGFIYISFIYIFIATILLSISYVVQIINTLSSILFSLIIVELQMGIKICKIMLNEEYCRDIVEKYYETIVKNNRISLIDFSFHLDKLSVALDTSIKENRKEDKDKLIDMICTLTAFMKEMENKDEYYDYFNRLNAVIKKYVIEISLNFGYNEMIKDVVKIYENVSEKEFDRNDMLLRPLIELQFYDDKILNHINYLNEILDLDLLDEYKENKITDYEIQLISYNYISNILKNQLCSEKSKNSIIIKYISELTKHLPRRKTNDNLTIQHSSLLNILKYFILENENIYERKFIFVELVKNTFIHNEYNKDNSYFNYLSIVFQAFYSYAILEKEMLTLTYRNQLKELFKMDIQYPYIARLNLAFVLERHIKEVVSAIAIRIENNDKGTRMFEYFPPYMRAKSIIWTKEFNINFMLLLYFLYSNKIGYYSLYNFFKWEKIEPTNKIYIINEFMKCFDLEKGILNKYVVEKIEKLADMTNHSFITNDSSQQRVFEYLRKEHERLFIEKVNIIEKSNLDFSDIKTKLNELMEKENVFGWTSNNIEDATNVEYSVPEYIKRKESSDIGAARNIQDACLSAINQYIKMNTNKLELTFDENGIIKMRDFVNQFNYDSRNYTFTDDWAFSKELRSSDAFIEIVSRNENIENIRTNGIESYMFFNKDKFKFNVEIITYDCIELTEKECVEYIEDSKAYNGLYNIDGVLMAKDKSIDVIKKLYCKEKIVLKLITSISNNDVTQIIL